ncbi:hypothetical protein CVT24_008317 [Panaeolus cyanescens]|uniref:F-box domain-containing protein n=1 Tax=Panaeolus cyanescens TaxID=181874 RepID=A0A409YLR6_9AGAR|nr:hypothetical protein CVT24_008317 [Panaeolus cyanescens]
MEMEVEYGRGDGQQIQTQMVDIDPMLPTKVLSLDFNAILFQTKADELSAQFNGLYKQLQFTVLRARQSEVNAEMCASLQSPIRKLPYKILVEILYLGSIPGRTILRANGPPFTFRRVCRYWKDIVSNDGLLWDYLRSRSEIDSRFSSNTLARIRQAMGIQYSHNGPRSTTSSVTLFTDTHQEEGSMPEEVLAIPLNAFGLSTVSFGISSINKDRFQMRAEYGHSGEQIRIIDVDPMLPTKCSQFNDIRNKCIRMGGSPSDEELALLCAYKFQWHTEHFLLQKQVKELTSRLGALYRELLSILVNIRQMEINANVCTSLDAPIRHLSPKILCNIFYLCISENTKVSRSGTAPLHLLEVCKYWNKIVTDEHSLWNRIRFDINSSFSNNSLRRIKHVLSIYRSGSKSTAPFSLGLFTTVRCEYGEKGMHERVMRLIRPHLQWCKGLYLASTNANWYERFSSFPPDKLKSLESLYLNFEDTGSGRADFRQAQKLKKVDLVLWKRRHIRQLLLPYQQLLHLSVSMKISRQDFPNPVSTFVNMLAHCTNLESLQVAFEYHYNDRATRSLNVNSSLVGPHPIILSSLRTFKLVSEFSSHLVDFVKSFKVPRLTNLSVDAFYPFHLSYRDGPPLADVVNAHLGGPLSFFSQLVELELVHVSLNQEEIQDLLYAAKQLEKLTMMNLLSSSGSAHGACWIDNKSLLDLLVIHPRLITPADANYGQENETATYTPLVPRLCNLRLFCSSDTKTSPRFPVETLVEVSNTRKTWLKSSSVHYSGLSHNPKFVIHITFEGGCQDLAFDIEQSLKDLGVTVSVKHQDTSLQKILESSYRPSASSIATMYPL